MWYRFGKSGTLRIEAHAELAQDGQFHRLLHRGRLRPGDEHRGLADGRRGAWACRGTQVEVVNGDTARVPDSAIQGASRATYFVGGAVTAAAARCRTRSWAWLPSCWIAPPSRCDLQEDRVVAPDGANVSLTKSPPSSTGSASPDGCAASSISPSSFPTDTNPEYVPLFVTGAHVAEVEVDLRTGEVCVLRMAAAHDVGRVVNRLDAEGQIEGAMIMGVGAALMEEVIPGHTTGFADYYLPDGPNPCRRST